jgi:hypothetical protein
MKKLIVVCLFAFMLVPALLLAQDSDAYKGKFGLTFPDIGAIFHISDNVAFLPGFSFRHQWSGHSDLLPKHSDNALGVEANVRFYLPGWKDVRFYLSPKYRFIWNDLETESDIIFVASTSYTHNIVGAWGLQYAFNTRLSIFGDIGFGYGHQIYSSISPNRSSNHVGTEGSWGLILYLK